jgi:hypothetical protein
MGGSPVGVGSVPTVTTLTLSSATKATLFRIILWRCWATVEHGIAQPKLFLASGRGCLVHCCRLRGVELAIALFDATGPLVPGNGGTDMVWSSPRTGSGDFRLGLAGCQRKNLIAR